MAIDENGFVAPITLAAVPFLHRAVQHMEKKLLRRERVIVNPPETETP